MIFLMYLPAFVPFLTCAAITIAGCCTGNMASVWAGIILMVLYDPKPEMAIIARTRFYNNCTLNIVSDDEQLQILQQLEEVKK